MIRIARVGCLVLSGLLAGCAGGPLTSGEGSAPPHGGSVLKLPGGKGFVEVVKKVAASSKAAASGEISFYVLKDMNTPYTPAPSSGTLTVGKKKVTLKPEGEALVTPGGPSLFNGQDPDGVLSFELDGQSVSIPLGVR
jgi:hypothetical protein